MNKILSIGLFALAAALVIGFGYYFYKKKQDSPSTSIPALNGPILGTMQTGQIDSGAASTSRTPGNVVAPAPATVKNNDVTVRVSNGYQVRAKHNSINVYTQKGTYAGSVQSASFSSGATSLDMQESALKLSPDAKSIRRGTYDGKPAIFYKNTRTGKESVVVVSDNKIYYIDGAATTEKNTDVVLD